MLKKIFVFLLCCVLLCGCSVRKKAAVSVATPPAYRVGIWLSYVELDAMMQKNFADEYRKVLENCKQFGITDLFVQVRPFCDAVYPSDLFPMRASAKSYDGDALREMVDQTHAAGLYFHAWINPYRVRTRDENAENLPADSPAKAWVEDAEKVCFSDGIYLNPAGPEVRRLILDGIRELLSRYDIDGIHFDDYFYPTADASFDSASYMAYRDSCAEPLSLEDWRRANVNALISAVYTTVKFQDKSLIFSVSPAASIEKNRTAYFADVAAWMESGCVDWIIPQLYFGLHYPQEDFCFDRLLSAWRELPRAETVRLIIGLAAYKINVKEMPDTEEWYMNTEVLADEVQLCRQAGDVSGHAFYSYTALFSTEPTNTRARRRLMEEQNVTND